MRAGLYRRAEGVTMQEMDGELFLADDASGAIYRMNVVASAFWRGLEEPRDLPNIINLFSEAFPDQDREILERDISDLAEDLETQGLILKDPA